jgi:DNA-binding IclR family transcriptional regulator
VSREDPDFIESVEKAFRVLQAFSTDDPVMTVSRAAELTGLTRSVAVLDDKEIVYVAGMPAKRSLSLTLTIGSRLPAYPTSMGCVLLAALPRARFDEYLATTTLEKLTKHTVTDVRQFREIIAGVRRLG